MPEYKPNYVILALTACAVLAVLLKKTKNPPLPPGPRGLPIVGCLFSMPRSHLWLWFDKLFQRYGPLVSFRFANQVFIIIGDYDLSQEILVKRAGRNSSRPPMYAFDLMSQGRRFIFLKDNDPGWRTSRKLVSQVMGEVRQGRSAKLSEFECKYTMQRILAAPEDWKAQFQRFAGSSILGATYGIHVPVENTGELKRLHERAKRTNVLANPRSYAVNAFPVLDKFIPDVFAPWRKLVREVEAEGTLFTELCDKGLKNGEDGIENWLWRFTKNRDFVHLKDSTVTLPYLAGEIFGAGINTTWISLQNFVLASLLYPNAFNDAKKEIERVVGTERLPLFSDREYMPHCEAVYREILRWRVAVPHGLYHEQTADDIVEVGGRQYFIPKGAVLIGAIYTIEHDPVRYPEPHVFKPQRQLDNEGRLKPDETTAFGFGRRACVGRPMAEKSIWMMITTMMWLFDVVRPDGDTAPLDQYAETGSAVAHPGAFRAVLRAKSPHHQAVARRDYDEYDKNLAHLVA